MRWNPVLAGVASVASFYKCVRILNALKSNFRTVGGFAKKAPLKEKKTEFLKCAKNVFSNREKGERETTRTRRKKKRNAVVSVV